LFATTHNSKHEKKEAIWLQREPLWPGIKLDKGGPSIFKLIFREQNARRVELPIITEHVPITQHFPIFSSFLNP
jgi:hypothetical protein